MKKVLSALVLSFLAAGLFHLAGHESQLEAGNIRASDQSAWQKGTSEADDEAVLRVLIVAGHDKQYPGAEYGQIRELDLNVALGYYLYAMIETDPQMDSMISHQPDGTLSPWLVEYLRANSGEVEQFRRQSKAAYNEQVKSGAIEQRVHMIHNYAPSSAVPVLYAINKFANDHLVDVVLHIHFNDEPGRWKYHQGKYEGFSIYVPESQLQNASESRAFAEALAERLSRILPVSNHPLEAEGIVEDQDLIAIGSNGTRVGASILIEYGYIYEDALHDEDNRELFLKELALQTYLGLRSFFYYDYL